MTRTSLLLDSLRYHARANLTVGLGSAVGAAVLAGALLVGDSLRGSLRDRADRQLGGYQHALIGDRFFRQAVANDLPGQVQPVILLQGTVRAGERRVGKVTIIGATADLPSETFPVASDTVTVSDALARALDVQPGSRIQVNVQKASAIPRSSALAKRDTGAATQKIELTVGQVLPPGHPGGEFTLSPDRHPR